MAVVAQPLLSFHSSNPFDDNCSDDPLASNYGEDDVRQQYRSRSRYRLQRQHLMGSRHLSPPHQSKDEEMSAQGDDDAEMGYEEEEAHSDQADDELDCIQEDHDQTDEAENQEEHTPDEEDEENGEETLCDNMNDDDDEDDHTMGDGDMLYGHTHDDAVPDTADDDIILTDDDDEDVFTDEENTIKLRAPSEQREVEEEIRNLEVAVPRLADDYRLVDRLGTGTFSSVYKAVDLHHTKWDNSVWFKQQERDALAAGIPFKRNPRQPILVAVKRINTTSSSMRIMNEIELLDLAKGSRNVTHIITAFRDKDQVVAIMPYYRSQDFRVSRFCLS